MKPGGKVFTKVSVTHWCLLSRGE